MIAIIKLLEKWAAPFYTKNVSLLPHAHVCNDRKWCSLALENEAILSCKATQVSVGCWWQRRIQRDLKSLKTFGHFLFFSKEFVRGRFLSSTFFMATGMHGKLVVQHHHPFLPFLLGNDIRWRTRITPNIPFTKFMNGKTKKKKAEKILGNLKSWGRGGGHWE